MVGVTLIFNDTESKKANIHIHIQIVYQLLVYMACICWLRSLTLLKLFTVKYTLRIIIMSVVLGSYININAAFCETYYKDHYHPDQSE